MIEPDCKRAEELLRSVLLSNRLSAVETTAPNTWDFQFSGAHLNVSVPWRILDGESIRMGSCDHDQKFGLPQPIDGVAVTMELLGQRRVEHLTLERKSADLKLVFEGSFFLDIFNQSAGWEGWNLTASDGTQVIALGGGDIAFWSKLTSPSS